MKQQGEDKAFIAAQATNVKSSPTGLEGSASSSVAIAIANNHKSLLTISGYDARNSPRNNNSTKSATTDGIPVTLNAGKDPRLSVRIGCFSGTDATPSPKKLSVDQLKSFQVSPTTTPTKNNFRSVTFIGGPQSAKEVTNKIKSPVSPLKMMTMMSSTAIPLDNKSSNSANKNSSSSSSSASTSSSSSSSAEMDNFALDSGTCSDLEINSSSSSLNNSITPPPPPLPKKMNKTKEKLKSENEKFFHSKSYGGGGGAKPGATITSVGLNDQDDNMSVLSCGSNNSNCSSISLISCDSLNTSQRRRLLLHHNRSNLMVSPNTTMTTTTSCSSSNNGDSPTPSQVSSMGGGGDPPVIVSSPDKTNAIVLSVKAAAVVAPPPSPPMAGEHTNRYTVDLNSNVNSNQQKTATKNLLPTSLLADIRKRSNGDLQKKKNVNVISIRAPSNGDNQSNRNNATTTMAIEFQKNEQEKYLSKKFINFSINSMVDEGLEDDLEDDDDDGKMDNGYFGRSLNNSGGRGVVLKSAFASMDSRKSLQFENDSFYNFHINENKCNYLLNKSDKSIYETNEDSFAGYRDLATAYSPMSGSSTIRSNKGTIRGVKNRVRNGIATFLQMQDANVKVNILF